MTREQRDHVRDLTHAHLRRLIKDHPTDAREIYLIVGDIADCGRAEIDRAKRETKKR